MIRESELVNLPILNEDFKKVNFYIQRPIYSKEFFRVIGFTIKNRKLTRNMVLPYKRIKDIGKKHIIISSEKDLVELQQIPEIKEALLKPIKIINFEIYNHQRDLIGIIKDTFVEKKTGKILAFIISEGVFDDVIRGHSILPLVEGFDLEGEKMIVEDKTISAIVPQGGGLKKLLGID